MHISVYIDAYVHEGALAGYQRDNFAVACAAAGAWLGALDDAVVAGVAARISVPGRLQLVGERPLTILDGAHNPSGVEALAAALPERPFVAVVSILDDKDAGAMLARAARPLRRVRLHRRAEPARAAAGHAGVARAAARRRRGDRPRSRARRSTGRARWPARRAPSSSPARSTWSPICVSEPGARRASAL